MQTLPKGTVKFNCDFCEQVTHTKRSMYERRKNHFCSRECYGKFVKRRNRAKILQEFKPTTIEEFKKEYPDVPEEWVHPSDFDKPYIYADPFEMFNKGKEK